MNRYIIFTLFLILSIKICGQDFYSMLDYSYIEYCRNNDAQARSIFVKNFSFYPPHDYSIEKNRKCKIYNEVKKNLKNGTLVLDFPTILLRKDSICIINHELEVCKTGFHFGESYISWFVYDRSRAKWSYAIGGKPELESRNWNFNETLLKKCVKKAIDSILNQNSGKKISIYGIQDYFPIINDNDINIPFLAFGENASVYKSKVDYFIGYPEINLNNDVLSVSIKIIKSSDMTTPSKLTNYQTVSVELNIHSLL